MEQMKLFSEEELKKNDELTSTALYASLDLTVSASTINRVRREMGWVCTRPHYCQLLHEVCAVRSKDLISILLVSRPIVQPEQRLVGGG